MEWAVYRVFWSEDGRRMGALVDMLASCGEAEAFARRRDGEHEIVGLWTREIDEEDAHLWDNVVFDEEGGLTPVGRS